VVAAAGVKPQRVRDERYAMMALHRSPSLFLLAPFLVLFALSGCSSPYDGTVVNRDRITLGGPPESHSTP